MPCEVFQVALRKLGYSGNTTDPKEIEAAYNELKKLMPNVAAFNSDNPANPYGRGSKSRHGVERLCMSCASGRYAAGGRLAEAAFSGWTAWLFLRMRKTLTVP